MSQFNQYSTFVTVYRTSSISRAAEHLNLTPSAVSKQISLLEERLAVQLFERANRQLIPTQQARDFYPDCLNILKSVEHAEAQVKSKEDSVSGSIRVTLSSSLASSSLIECFEGFSTAYPDIKLELSVTETLIDLFDSGYDFAFRIGELADSTRLIAIPLQKVTPLFYACSHYSNHRSLPANITELKQHKLAMPPMHQLSDEVRRQLKAANFNVDHKNCLVVDDLVVLHRLVKSGKFLGFNLDYALAKELKEGTVQSLNLDFKFPQKQLHLVYKSNSHMAKHLSEFKQYVRHFFVQDSESQII